VKLTKTKLKQIIKEEIKRVLHETWGHSAPQGFDAPRNPETEKAFQQREREKEFGGMKKGRDLKSRDPDTTFTRNSIKADLTKRGADVDMVGPGGGLFMRLLSHLERNEVPEAVALAIEMGAQDDGDLARQFDMYT
jgi:hypothetical protein